MDCGRCGGPMMPETVVKLRRGLFGLRATQSEGAYCATCRTGVLLEGPPRRRAPAPAFNRLFRSRPSDGLPAWQRLDVSRASCGHCVELPRLTI